MAVNDVHRLVPGIISVRSNPCSCLLVLTFFTLHARTWSTVTRSWVGCGHAVSVTEMALAIIVEDLVGLGDGFELDFGSFAALSPYGKLFRCRSC